MLPAETVDAIHRMEKYPSLVPIKQEYTFAMPELRENELFFCPMLCETGCTMGEEKPFDCKIWPFRVMRDDTGIVRIAVASYCPGMASYTDAQLHDFLSEELAQQVLSYAEQHPAHIKAYSSQYRFVW